MYHRIAEEHFDPWGLAVSPKRFAAQLDWLARRRRVLPLSEFAERIGTGKLPDDGIAITFDDGYLCNATQAVPELRKHGMSATIFLPVALIETGGEYWWDELARVILDHRGSRLTIVHPDGEEEELLLGERQDKDWIWPPGKAAGTARQLAFYTAWFRMRRWRARPLARALALMKQQAGISRPRESHRMMQPEEIRAVQSDLIAMGSHTLEHASLIELDSHAKAIEIEGSMARCEALTGRRPTALAYPYGDYDAECERLAEQAGFTCACTTEPCFVGQATRPFALPRLQVGDWSSSRLAAALPGALADAA